MEEKPESSEHGYFAELRKLVEEANERNLLPGEQLPTAEWKAEAERLCAAERANPTQHAFFGVQLYNDKYLRLRYRQRPDEIPAKPDIRVHDLTRPGLEEIVASPTTGPNVRLEMIKDWVLSDEPNRDEEFRYLIDLERALFDRLTGRAESFDLSWTPKEEIDHLRGSHLLVQINRASTRIARQTRRGRGNNVIVSQYVLDFIRRIDPDQRAFVPYTEASIYPTMMPGSILTPVGTLYGYARLFLNPDWSWDHPILVGYKGHSNIDAGVFVVRFPTFYVLKTPEEDKKLGWGVDWDKYFYGVRIEK